METANVAPVGLNDLALKPLPASPAKLITSSNIFDTVLLEMALYGGFSVNNEHREMRPKASSSVVEYPILIAYPSMYGMLKVCSVKDLHFRISSARVKSSL